jgi:hypothetical protein
LWIFAARVERPGYSIVVELFWREAFDHLNCALGACDNAKMVRGHAKAEAQARNAKRTAELAKSQKGSQRGMAEKALNTQCPICKQQMPTARQLADHYASRHPRDALPPEIQEQLSAQPAPARAAAEQLPPPQPDAAKPKKKTDELGALLSEGLGAKKKK